MLNYWWGSWLQHMNLEERHNLTHNRSSKLQTSLWEGCATWSMLIISMSSEELSTGLFGSWWELSVWITKSHLVCPYMVERGEGISSYRGNNLIRDLCPYNPITSLRPLFSHTIIWWIRASAYEFWVDTIQFTASTILYNIHYFE